MVRRLAWPAVVVGAVLAVVGIVVMVVLGPDSRFTTGPHEVDTDGVAVVTAPGVISWHDLRVDVLVEVPVDKPVFVGLGNTVDVQDYVGSTQRLEVTSFRVPWTARTREVAGRPALPGAPTALDWWIADSAGLGGASISVTLPDQSVSLAVLAVGASDLSGLRVTFAYGVAGGFARGVAALLVGVGLVWGGLLLRRAPAPAAPTDAAPVEEVEEVEEVVYVFVDERGVEHEISAEEAERLQERLDAGPAPGGTSEPDDAPATPPAPAPTTAQDTGSAQDTGAVQDTGSAQARDVAPEPEPEPASAGAVVYVFVDEDGIEHEVPADELDEYEVVEEEETR